MPPDADDRGDPAEEADGDVGGAQQQGDQKRADVESFRHRPQPGEVGALADRVQQVVEDGEDDEAQGRRREEEQRALRPTLRYVHRAVSWIWNQGR